MFINSEDNRHILKVFFCLLLICQAVTCAKAEFSISKLINFQIEKEGRRRAEKSGEEQSREDTGRKQQSKRCRSANDDDDEEVCEIGKEISKRRTRII